MGAATATSGLGHDTMVDGGAAKVYAQRLLDSLDVEDARPLEIADEHPALAWVRSGLMSLTGEADGPPQMCPLPLVSCADGALAALAALAPRGALDGVSGAQLLGERAAISGYTRCGDVSPGGSCHLLQAMDGGIAINLARVEDWALTAAWLARDEPIVAGDWTEVYQCVRRESRDELVARGRLIGLAVCADGAPALRTNEWSATVAQRPAKLRSTTPLVIDLSALWAGPLCGNLLHTLGARVIKLESRQRPDGARNGPPAFFNLLNAGKRSVVLDFASAPGRAQLRALLAQADIVIEASRPRALRQLGIDAEAMVTDHPGLTWIAISGYGRGEPQGNWAAYGDDAAVAAGLSDVMHRASGRRLICGDAIADPLTGLHAALAAWASFRGGGGRLISLALSDVAGYCLHFDLPDSDSALRARLHSWEAVAAQAGGLPIAPQARATNSEARALGADTAQVLAEFGLAC